MTHILRIDEMTIGQRNNLQSMPYNVGEMIGMWKVTTSKAGYVEFVFCPYGDARTPNDLITGSTTDDKTFLMFRKDRHAAIGNNTIMYEMPKDAFFAYEDTCTDIENYNEKYKKK